MQNVADEGKRKNESGKKSEAESRSNWIEIGNGV